MIYYQITNFAKLEIVDVAFVYGLHNVGARKKLWEDLNQVATKVDKAWLIIRDFNSVFGSD